MRYRFFVGLSTYLYSGLLAVLLWYSEEFVAYIWYIYAMLLVLFIVEWLFIIKNIRRNKEYVMMGIGPLIFLASGLAFYVLADSDMLRHVYGLLLTLGIFFLLRALYFYFWHSAKYQPNALQVQLKYIHIVAIFFVATFLYALEVFLNISQWYTAGIFLITTLLFLWQRMYIERLQSKERIVAVYGAVLFTQVFIAIGFLPFLVYVKGSMMMLIYFMVQELYEAALRGLWQQRQTVTLIGVVVLVIALLLASTPWY